MSYDYHQLSVIASGLAEPVRVVRAGAGSGKTHTLIGCIQQWIKDGIEHPSRIVVVTFTRKAAAELNRRLSALGISVGYVGTIHSLAHTMLRRWGSHWTLVDDDDLQSLTQMVAIRNGLDVERSDVSKAILAVTREIGSSKRAFPKHDLQATALLNLTRGAMARQRVVYIDQILEKFLRALDETPGFRDMVRTQIQALAWDEYQDSNPVEEAIRSRIAPRNQILVGDVRQAIYGFRGGNSSLLVAADGRHMELPRNYRSRPSIVELANRMYPEIPMEATREDEPRTVSLAYCEQDPAVVAGAIEYDVDTYGPITVLARTNREVDALAEVLESRGRRVFVASSARDRFRQPFWANLSLLARFLSDPSCDWTAYRLLRVLGYAHLDEAVRQANGKSLWRTIQVLSPFSPLEPLVSADIADTWTIFKAAEMIGLSPEALFLTVPDGDLPLLGMTVSEFGAWYSTRNEQDQVTATDAEVTLCTVHAAKGLEWNHVAVVGLGKTIPSRFGTEEEERAVLYVALTRARDRLLIVGTPEAIPLLEQNDNEASSVDALFERCRKTAE